MPSAFVAGTRYWINLPITTPLRQYACQRVINRLTLTLDGASFSGTRASPGGWSGFWKNDKGKVIKDSICILFVDLPFSISESEDAALAYYRFLQGVAAATYRILGVPEDEIWVRCTETYYLP